MSNAQAISWADLRQIENYLTAIHSNVNILEQNVNTQIKSVTGELETLLQEFRCFAEKQRYTDRILIAETRLVKIRQKLENDFGHYAEIRRTTIGVLQANDLGIVRMRTINNVAEEMMLTASGYWLTPCLVALSAWINDKPELADRAMKEALRRNDEKTSLLFTLICRRAERGESCRKWLERYLANQDEEQMNRICVVVLDAFAGGLLGVDSERVVMRYITKWLDSLAIQHDDFFEQQRGEWRDAINLKRDGRNDPDYSYLKKHSKSWQKLKYIMAGAELHGTMLDYFEKIFEHSINATSVKKQIDDVLSGLIEDFDDEEAPLRKDERLEQLVVDFSGDEGYAKERMRVEQTSFERSKNFIQILTDIALKTQSSQTNASVRRFAIALTRDWIVDAYNDVTAYNRMQIPGEIDITIDTFNGKSADGRNETDIVREFNGHIDEEKSRTLASHVLHTYDKVRLLVAGGVAVFGAYKLLTAESTLLGAVILAVSAFIAYKPYVQFKTLRQQRKRISFQYEEKRENNVQILRAVLAEIVDFRAEFAEKDTQSSHVVDFLKKISPEQYIQKIAGSGRRIHITAK